MTCRDSQDHDKQSYVTIKKKEEGFLSSEATLTIIDALFAVAGYIAIELID